MSISSKFSIGAVTLAGILCNQRVEGALDRRDCIYGNLQIVEVENSSKRKITNYSFEGEQIPWRRLVFEASKQYNDKEVYDCDKRVDGIIRYYQDIINQKDESISSIRTKGQIAAVGSSLFFAGLGYFEGRRCKKAK